MTFAEVVDDVLAVLRKHGRPMSYFSLSFYQVRWKVDEFTWRKALTHLVAVGLVQHNDRWEYLATA